MSDLHEEVGDLTDAAKDAHRALTSLKEELEAVDWYNQRAAATHDDAIRAVLAHNRDEEIEHACMLLEWLRRNIPKFDEHLRTYLFTTEPITSIEKVVSEDGVAPANASGAKAAVVRTRPPWPTSVRCGALQMGRSSCRRWGDVIVARQ